MSTLLVKNSHILVTMDNHRREIPGGGLFIRDGFIERVGTADQLPAAADEVLDLTNHILLPGLVNTHHHFYQTLTRAIPAAKRQPVSLVEDAVPDMGENDPGRYPPFHANSPG